MGDNSTSLTVTELPADKPTILLVGKTAEDILLVKRSFERVGLGYPLQVVRNTGDAKKYLKGELLYANRARFPLPGLLLLDLHGSEEADFEFLTWLRHEPEFTTMPVVVLTAPDQINAVNRAYQLGANSFLVKPDDFENFVETSRQLQRHWLKLSSHSGTTAGT